MPPAARTGPLTRSAPRLLPPGPPPGCGSTGSCSSRTAGPCSGPEPDTPRSTCSPHNPGCPRRGGHWPARGTAQHGPTAPLPLPDGRAGGRCCGECGPTRNRRRALRARNAEPGAVGLRRISGQPPAGALGRAGCVLVSAEGRPRLGGVSPRSYCRTIMREEQWAPLLGEANPGT